MTESIRAERESPGRDYFSTTSFAVWHLLSQRTKATFSVHDRISTSEIMVVRLYPRHGSTRRTRVPRYNNGTHLRLDKPPERRVVFSYRSNLLVVEELPHSLIDRARTILPTFLIVNVVNASARTASVGLWEYLWGQLGAFNSRRPIVVAN